MRTPVSTEVFVNFVFLIWDFKISACRCSPDHGDLPHLGSWQWCRHHRLCATYGLCHLVALGAWSAIHPSNGPITAQFLRSVWKLHWKDQIDLARVILKLQQFCAWFLLPESHGPWAISVYWDHCLVPPGHKKQQQSRLVWASNCECWRVWGLGAILLLISSQQDWKQTWDTRHENVGSGSEWCFAFDVLPEAPYDVWNGGISAQCTDERTCWMPSRCEHLNTWRLGIVLRPWCWGFHSSGQKLRRHRHPQTWNSNLDRSASLVFDTVNRVVGVEPLLSGLLGREGSEHQKSHCIPFCRSFIIWYHLCWVESQQNSFVQQFNRSTSSMFEGLWSFAKGCV